MTLAELLNDHSYRLDLGWVGELIPLVSLVSLFWTMAVSQPTDTSRNTKAAPAPCGQGRNTEDGCVAIFSKIPAMVLRTTSVLRNSKAVFVFVDAIRGRFNPNRHSKR